MVALIDRINEPVIAKFIPHPRDSSIGYVFEYNSEGARISEIVLDSKSKEEIGRVRKALDWKSKSKSPYNLPEKEREHAISEMERGFLDQIPSS